MKYIFVGFFFLLLGFSLSVDAQNSILTKGEQALENGKIEKARTLFLSLSENEKAKEYLGDIASFEKKWDTALGYYKALVKEHPNNASYNFKAGGAMGMKALEISKFKAVFLLDDIKDYLSKAATLDSKNAEVRRALVEFYISVPGIMGGSDKKAQKYADELENINPIDAQLSMGYIYKHSGQKSLSKKAFKKAARIALRQPEFIKRNYMYYELGEATANLQLNPKNGISFLQKYLQNYGYKDLAQPEKAYVQMAKIMKQEYNKPKALKYINKALWLKPDFKEAKKQKEEILEL